MNSVRGVKRLFVREVLRDKSAVTLTGDAVHYLRTVLRAKPQSPSGVVQGGVEKGAAYSFELFNGDGQNYICNLTAIDRKRAVFDVLSSTDNTGAETRVPVHVYVPFIKPERFDWMLQKGTEIGASSFTPILTERTNVPFREDKKEKKYAHWRGVIESACMQSGRSIVPPLYDNTSLPAAVATISHLHQNKSGQLFLFANPSHPLSLSQTLRQVDTTTTDLSSKESSIHLFVGPEGGFSSAEEDLMHHPALLPFHLGPRILRTETAVLCSLATLQTILDL